jgi:8-oxo-dGTP pyrophosphatase MutT (NUDIX family)
MRAYLSTTYNDTIKRRKLIEDLSETFESIGVHVRNYPRDISRWGQVRRTHDELVQRVLNEIDKADLFIAEASEADPDVCIEAGYAHAQGKIVITLSKAGSKAPEYLSAVSNKRIEYKDMADMTEQMQRYTKTRGAVFIFLNEKREALMQLRDETSSRYQHMWSFPGGGAKVGEDLFQTAVREIKEELDITVQKKDLFVLADKSNHRGMVFVIKLPKGIWPKCYEGAEVRFMSMKEIEEKPLAFQQRWIAVILRRHIDALPKRGKK